MSRDDASSSARLPDSNASSTSSDGEGAAPSSATAAVPPVSSAARSSSPIFASAFVRDVGGTLALWFALFTLENLAATRVRPAGYRLGELAQTELHAVSMALAFAVPFAVVVVVLGRLVAARKSLIVALVGALAASALAYGVSTGRHMQGVAVRAGFVAALTVVAFSGAYLSVKRLPLQRTSWLALGGAAVASAAWLADAFVLQRLYPAFHLALFVLALLGVAAIWTALRTRRVARTLSLVGLALGVVSCAWLPGAVHAVAADEPLRGTLFTAAPLLSRPASFALRFAPSSTTPTAAGDQNVASVMTFSEQSRTLDWTDKDILLVTIDALRADHLGTYGYARRTSPNIDALASRGVRFDYAYSPISNTSYSISSLMTGKYMYPLLVGGVKGAERSETWANHLQRMGYATAGFFPPAIFYVDAHDFRFFQETAFGFAHHEERYAEASKRRDDVARFLTTVPADKPAFVWVHIFEPHEPYVMHREFPFEGNRPMDAYDSEIAAADALVGDVVKLIDARRRDPVVILTADHGEAFGEHGANYHNSDVFEEQVRVPMIVVGPGVTAGAHVPEPVQTIDLLATTLSALGRARPVDLRGRDLGRLLAPNDAKPSSGGGFAFAETEQQSMVAQGSERLVCMQNGQTCALFDVTADPLEQSPVRGREERAAFLKLVTAAVVRENSKGTAAEVEDDKVAQMKRLDTEALVTRLADADPSARLAAAFVLAGRRDARAVPVLVRALDDVAMRPQIVQALQTIGDPSAKAGLLAALDKESYADLRTTEVRALLALGAGAELGRPLARFATLPDPMFDAIQYAEMANVLRPESGGIAFPEGTDTVDVELKLQGTGPSRLLVRTFNSSGKLTAHVDGAELSLQPTFGQLWGTDLAVAPKDNAKVRVVLQRKSKIRSVWLVRIGEAKPARAP